MGEKKTQKTTLKTNSLLQTTAMYVLSQHLHICTDIYLNFGVPSVVFFSLRQFKENVG